MMGSKNDLKEIKNCLCLDQRLKSFHTSLTIHFSSGNFWHKWGKAAQVSTDLISEGVEVGIQVSAWTDDMMFGLPSCF